ncbi:MAG: ferredoxin [Candidatus Melainabacteria bacterium HGW-Melainabacteria-1]|nr:MAG: ferredoxin [Candidatus Melainabacteria bacterium HGW-Melainabacteria-1]
MLSMSPQDALSEVLDVLNSPVLFGCRTGICATCLVRVHAGMENLPPADENEQEVLEIYAEDQPDCRLACQLKLRGDVTLEYIGHG